MNLHYTRDEINRAKDVIDLPLGPGKPRQKLIKSMNMTVRKLLDDWLALDAARKSIAAGEPRPRKADMITKAGFIELWCKSSRIKPNDLRGLGQHAIPCKCGEPDCRGWQMVTRDREDKP